MIESNTMILLNVIIFHLVLQQICSSNLFSKRESRDSLKMSCCCPLTVPVKRSARALIYERVLYCLLRKIIIYRTTSYQLKYISSPFASLLNVI